HRLIVSTRLRLAIPAVGLTVPWRLWRRRPRVKALQSHCHGVLMRTSRERASRDTCPATTKSLPVDSSGTAAQGARMGGLAPRREVVVRGRPTTHDTLRAVD